MNRSATCAGLSNVFGTAPMADVLRAACAVAPDLPLTGYERGDALAKAIDVGFSCIGHLRVLVPDPQRKPSHAS
jgi:hypothetical protein